MKILLKLCSFALMIISPIIAGKAFYEYINVKHFNHKPSWPFGKELMDALHFGEVKYLSTYADQMLSIAVVFLLITILIYISAMVKALFRLAWLALFIFAGFFVYRLFA